MDRLFATDLVVMEDPAAQEYVLTLKGRVVFRVPYAEVYEARRQHPDQSFDELVIGLVPGEIAEVLERRD